MNGVIYMYTAPNGKQYIGQTFWPSQRRYQHKNASGNIAFHKAVRKYGFSNLIYTELHSGIESRDSLNTLERLEILSKKTYYPYGYNISNGGESHSHTSASRKALSVSKKGKPAAWFNKPVFCYENGRIFESQTEAAKWIGALSINNNINKEQSTCFGRHFFRLDYTYDVNRISYPHKHNKIVCVETGKVFDSARQAALLVAGVSSTNITGVLNNPHKTCHGYHWATTKKYKDMKKASKKPRKNSSVKIKCSDTGVTYESVTEAALQKIGNLKARSYISERTKKGLPAYGLRWEYVY